MGGADGNLMDVVAGIIRKGDKILIAQRKDDCTREPGKWEFPGGKVEPGERPEESLRREIMEELGVSIDVGVEFCTSEVESNGMKIRLSAFLSDWAAGNARALDCRGFRWVRIEELAGFDWARADIPIMEKLVAGQRGRPGSA